MGFNCGIIGLPNVGKSTLFNALTSTMSAQAENYPFCTIKPNVGQVAVPDERLSALARLGRSKRRVETQISFVDIAGLLRGASRGEGLGNQFLSHIRNCDAVAHVLRCFEDDNVPHVDGSVDPLRDADTVETELMLADMEHLERRTGLLSKKAKAGDAEAKAQMTVIEPLLEVLRAGMPARSVHFDTEEQVKTQQQFMLLTAKPMLYICNVEERVASTGNFYTERVFARAAAEKTVAICIAAAMESESFLLQDPTARASGLSRLVESGYHLLDLITFFTVGPKEARAWTVRRGTSAVEAAGVIHSDLKKGFIRAAIIPYEDFILCNGEQGAREAGKIRREGKNYNVKDGDIIRFLFKD